jgi:type I restriction-modification system DNA methylase subunit
MTLHEAIEKVLRENKRPLTAKAIAAIINAEGFYTRNDSSPIEARQILSRIKNYPLQFDQINGQIILVEDQTWKKLLLNYWYVYNALRGIYNPADIQFILAVLIFYKRCFDLQNGNHSLSNHFRMETGSQVGNEHHIIEELFRLEPANIGPRGIFEECARLLSQLDRNKLREIYLAIFNIDTHELNDQTFGDAFEYILFLNEKENQKTVFSPTPYSLRELMVSILNPEVGSRLFDPVAGTGGLLIEANQYIQGKKLHYTGCEINKRVAQLGNMNLLMHGLNFTAIKDRDSFTEINNDELYDFIVADLPSSGITNSEEHAMLFNKYQLEPPRSGRSFGSLVLLILDKLNHRGKAVITVSEGFLMKKGKEKEIRDLLVERDVVESIISLPFGTLRPYTDGKASLLVLNKDKGKYLRRKIRFLTAKVADQDTKSVYLNNEEVLNAYKIESLFSKDSQIIDSSELKPDTNLSADGYDEQYLLASVMLKEGSGKLLSDLVTFKSGIQPDKQDTDSMGDLPLIKIENLSRDILETDVTLNITSRVYFSHKYQRSIINERCLLVARIGDNLKVTIFNPDQDRNNILIHSGIYALTPIDQVNGIDLEYLYYQFHSAFVLEQIKKRRLGSVMPYVSIAGLKEIVIPYVDKANQRRFIDSQKANLISEEKNRNAAVLKALGSKEVLRQSESDIIKTLTHQLRPTFMGINSLSNRIKRVIEKNKLGDIMEYEDELLNIPDPEIAEFTQQPDNFSIETLVDKLVTDSQHLSDILGIVDKVMNFKLSGDDFITVDLLEFLKTYKREKEIVVNHQYEIIVRGDPVMVSINEAAFKELLHQLLQNASDHGFIENIPGKNYRVQFVLKYNKVRDVASLEYSNNGAPYELQHKDFVNAFEKGRNSKGSGIGGNYVNRIVEAHKGQIKVAENYPKGFALTIELQTKQTLPYE